MNRNPQHVLNVSQYNPETNLILQLSDNSDPVKNKVFNVNGTKYILPLSSALKPQAVKNIAKRIQIKTMKTIELSSFLTKMKKSGSLVFYKNNIGEHIQQTYEDFFKLLFTKDENYFRDKIFQINKSKLIIPLNEIIKNNLLKRLKKVVYDDYKRSINPLNAIFYTSTNIGKLNVLSKFGKDNYFRTTALRRAVESCARGVISPSRDDVVYLPLKVFNSLFNYNEGDVIDIEFVLVIRYPTIKLHQILAFKCKPWEFDTIGIPTEVLDLYGADFDGDQVGVYPIKCHTLSIDVLLKLSIDFVIYSSQLNLHLPPSSLLYTNFDYKKEFMNIVQKNIIKNTYSKGVFQIKDIIKKCKQSCAERNECITLRDIIENTKAISLLPNATRFSKNHHNQITKSIGTITGSLTNESIHIDNSFLKGIELEKYFTCSRLLREAVIKGKISICNAGSNMTNDTFLNKSFYVNTDFSVSHNKTVISLTPLNLLYIVVSPSFNFLDACEEGFNKIYKC